MVKSQVDGFWWNPKVFDGVWWWNVLLFELITPVFFPHLRVSEEASNQELWEGEERDSPWFLHVSPIRYVDHVGFL